MSMLADLAKATCRQAIKHGLDAEDTIDLFSDFYGAVEYDVFDNENGDLNEVEVGKYLISTLVDMQRYSNNTAAYERLGWELTTYIASENAS